MTWHPGSPMLIPNRLVDQGGWIERQNVTTFNLYRPPTIKLGNPTEATRWLDHVRKLVGDDADYVITYFTMPRGLPDSPGFQRCGPAFGFALTSTVVGSSSVFIIVIVVVRQTKVQTIIYSIVERPTSDLPRLAEPAKSGPN